MILTDREILIALENEQLFIDPPPKDDAISSTSVDLTLATQGEIWTTAAGIKLSPGESGYKYKDIETLKRKIDLTGYELVKGSFVLGWTKEIIKLPNKSRVAARVEGKSNLARLGLGIHVTAPTIHAGFEGPIQLELFNIGPLGIILKPGMRICQLIFEVTLGTPTKGYQGAFFRQMMDDKT
jgi:dCTP deaminase